MNISVTDLLPMKHTFHLMIATLTSQVLAMGAPPTDAHIDGQGTRIYCASLLCTKILVNEKTGHTANEFRTALSKLIKARALIDKTPHFMADERISVASNLRSDSPGDPVHLSEDDTVLLADSLFHAVKNNKKVRDEDE